MFRRSFRILLFLFLFSITAVSLAGIDLTCTACWGGGACNLCEGSRRCHLCEGAGVIGVAAKTCEQCMGARYCHLCEGSGACNPCDGSGVKSL